MRFRFAFLLALAILTGPAAAQLISMKTVPVATGDQFLLFPSQNAAMGGVSIAVDDPLADSFVNPAKGMHLERPLVFGSPTLYSIAGNNGSARTLPIGGLFRSERVFGGALLALQELRSPDIPATWPVWTQWAAPVDVAPWPLAGPRLSEQSATNLYAFGLMGMRLTEMLSLGVSGFFSDLNRMEGVDLLYPNSTSLDQRGNLTNLRVGLVSDFEGGHTAEAIVLYNRVDMRHVVVYTEWVQDDEPNEEGWFEGRWVDRTEENLDISNTYGLHLGYDHAFRSGWRVGGIATGNFKTHPKIPNYDIMQIPRDPGDSRAFNVGLGVARTVNRATFGLDVVYEPIWSDTWADTPERLETPRGDVIPAGGKTVENGFWFGNALLRTGVSRIGERLDLLLGLQVKAINYDLYQRDNVQDTWRFQSEDWQEWTASFGLGLKFDEFHVRYLGRVLTGTGRPGVAVGWNWNDPAFRAGDMADILLAPQGALTLQETRVTTHQVSVSIPISN